MARAIKYRPPRSVALDVFNIGIILTHWVTYKGATKSLEIFFQRLGGGGGGGSVEGEWEDDGDVEACSTKIMTSDKCVVKNVVN